ncbi:hypothetical protein V6N13_003374 [Hibiscus sabdariffa]
MPWQYSPQQEHSNSLEETFQAFKPRPDPNMEFNQFSQKYDNIQDLSNSMDEQLARLDALLRESTYAMGNMLQQSTHLDTEILMQEVKEKCKESSPMCREQLEPLSQEHVDEEECPNELKKRIATTMIGEPGQSNMTTLSVAEKSN